MPEEYSIYRASMNLMCTQWEDGSQWEPLQGRNRSGRRAWWRKPLIILLVLTVMKIILYYFVFLSGGTNGNSYSYMHILIPFALYIIPGSLIPIIILPKILSRHLTIAFGYAGFISGIIKWPLWSIIRESANSQRQTSQKRPTMCILFPPSRTTI